MNQECWEIALKRHLMAGHSYFCILQNRQKRMAKTLETVTVPIGNRLYKFELTGNKLVNPKVLLDLPGSRHSAHNEGEDPNWPRQ